MSQSVLFHLGGALNERASDDGDVGNYVNFQQDDDDAARLEAAYRENFARLRRVKARYDPDNFFRVNRNIPPMA